jgi:hypothetical protein
MRGAIPPLPQYAFMARCTVKRKAQGQAYGYVMFWVQRSYPIFTCDFPILLKERIESMVYIVAVVKTLQNELGVEVNCLKLPVHHLYTCMVKSGQLSGIKLIVSRLDNVCIPFN